MITNTTSILTVALLFALLIFTAFDLKITVEYVGEHDERNIAVHELLKDILQ